MKTVVRIAFRRAAVGLLLVALIAGAGFLEAGICSDAYRRCLLDPFNTATFTGPLYCFNGYLFCLKYIQPK